MELKNINHLTYNNKLSTVTARNESYLKLLSIRRTRRNNFHVDIDITLDDMLGKEFAEHLIDQFTLEKQSKVFFGLVLCNPEKSKHLETAKVYTGHLCLDIVNLRAEEYIQRSRIPRTIHIGTAREDAYRRDFTINSLFYNLSTFKIEDWTGSGLRDLNCRLIATPLPALLTLLDDPLRVIRAIRFATRLNFYMDDLLKLAAMDIRVQEALDRKVSRERIGSEVDQMLRGRDPVCSIEWLLNLGLFKTVFLLESPDLCLISYLNRKVLFTTIFESGLNLLYYVYNRVHLYHLNVVNDANLLDNLWYAALLKPLVNYARNYGIIIFSSGKPCPSNNYSISSRLMVNHLKRPVRDAESVEKVIRAADDFAKMLLDKSYYLSIMVIREGIRVVPHLGNTVGNIQCFMRQHNVNSEVEEDQTWTKAMEFRLHISKIINRAGYLWKIALLLSISEHFNQQNFNLFNNLIENKIGEEIILVYDTIISSIFQLGLGGIWSQKPLIDGREIKFSYVLPNIPNTRKFREVMDKQIDWIVTHPTGSKKALVLYLRNTYSKYI